MKDEIYFEKSLQIYDWYRYEREYNKVSLSLSNPLGYIWSKEVNHSTCKKS